MKGKRVRRLGAAAVLALLLVVVFVGAAASASPQFTVADVTVAEDVSGGEAQFTVTLAEAAPAGGVAFKFSTADGSATAGSDYTARTNFDVSVAEGANTATFKVPVTDDTRDEPNEDFTVTVKHADGGEQTATATITDDDAPPAVTIGDATVTEGDSETSPANFNVQLSGPSGRSIVVRYTTVNGTATAPADYQAATGSITIPPGEDSGTVTVNVVGDTLPEPPPAENFTVVLQTIDNATPGADTQGLGTINDNDSPPAITAVGDASVTEGNADEVDANFLVTLSKAAPTPVTVRYSTAASSASSPSDYDAATSATMTIPAGQSSGTITVKVNGDTLPEGAGDPRSEIYFVDVLSATGATLGGDTRGTGTIVDDDSPPTVTGIGDVTVTEGNAGEVDARFEVTLSGNAPAAVAIGYSTIDGSATAPSDYTAATGTLTIPKDANKGTIVIKVRGDSLPEGSGDPRAESFFVDLTSVNGAQFGADRRGTATVVDDDAARTLAIVGAEVAEGDAGTVNLDLKVRLSGSTAQQVQVTATTADGSAVAPSDYQAKTQVLTWAPNSTGDDLEKTFRVLVNGDTLDEVTEALTVSLSSPQNAAIATGAATGTIRDNDSRSLLSVGNAEANEGAAGAKTTMTFKVTLSPASARPVAASYATANGTAGEGTDYEAKSGEVSFAPGETEKTVEIVVLGDDVNEENETVLLNLSNVAGAALAGGGGQGQGTIVDKNAPPSLSIDDVQAREGDGAEFTVTLAGTTLRTVTVTFGTSEGTAKEGSDYAGRRGTLTFAPGEKTKKVPVSVIDDTDSEPAETFSVGLGNPVNATVTKASGIATVEASDGPLAGAQGLGGGGNGLNNDRPPLRVNPKPAGPTPGVLPSMALSPTTLYRSGRLRMQATCNVRSPITCTGTITLVTTTKPALTLGKKSFAIRKGKKAAVWVPISTKGRKLLAKKRTLRVKLIVDVKSSTKKTRRVVPGTITVTLPKVRTSRATP